MPGKGRLGLNGVSLPLPTPPTHHILQALGHGMVSRVDEVDLDALHGQRALAGDLSGQVEGTLHHGFLVLEHTAGG